MVPSLTAVDDDGVPVHARPALRRRARAPGEEVGPARAGRARAVPALAGARAARRARLLDGAGRREPRALGRARSSRSTVAATAGAAVRLERRVGRRRCSPTCGARVEQMPVIGSPGPGARRGASGAPNCVLEGGSIDAIAEQLVAGADDVGDVLVILGTTLIVWAVMPEAGRRPELLRDAAHRAAASSSSAVRATRAACSSTGRPRCSATAPEPVDPGARPDLGAVPARRTRAAPGSRPARRSSSISTSRTDRGRDPPRRVRSDRVRRRAA